MKAVSLPCPVPYLSVPLPGNLSVSSFCNTLDILSKYVCMLNRVQLFVTLWTVAHQAPLSMEFSRQEYWSGLPFPPPEKISWPRDWTQVSCSCYVARKFFTTEPVVKEALSKYSRTSTWDREFYLSCFLIYLQPCVSGTWQVLTVLW